MPSGAADIEGSNQEDAGQLIFPGKKKGGNKELSVMRARTREDSNDLSR